MKYSIHKPSSVTKVEFLDEEDLDKWEEVAARLILDSETVAHLLEELSRVEEA